MMKKISILHTHIYISKDLAFSAAKGKIEIENFEIFSSEKSSYQKENQIGKRYLDKEEEP